jgi:hypothetical protein
LAAPFKLSHGSKGRSLAVYDHVRYGTALTIEYIVLCRGRLDCEAQNNRSCQTSACNKGHDRSSWLDFYYGPKLAAQKRFQCEARHKYL